jgi:uncharacterized membrane protein (UPF0127 family)
VRSRILLVGLLLLGASACSDDGGEEADDGSTPSSVTAVDIDGGIDLSVEGPRSDSGRVTIPGFDEVGVEVTNQAGEVLEWCLLLAAAAEQYSQGLMSVTDLGDYAGMLFDFPEGEQTGAFWMRDTALPLSIAYLDEDGGIVSTTDMDPCLDLGDQCPSYPPDGPYADTVEVAQGGLTALGLDGPDARLVTVGACAAPT